MRSVNVRAALGDPPIESGQRAGLGMEEAATLHLADFPSVGAGARQATPGRAYAVAATVLGGSQRDAARLSREVWVTGQVLMDDELHVHLLVEALNRSHARSEAHEQLGHVLGQSRVVSVVEVVDYDAALPELLEREGLLDEEFASFDDAHLVTELFA